jgi:POT family proton-dependent oligopeptide transporter
MTTKISAITKNNSEIYVISFAVLSERFSFWGIQAALVLFLIQSFSQTTDNAIATVGTFGALSYMFSLLGGIFSDKLLGAWKSCLIGLCLCILGNILLFCANTIGYINLGISCVLIGAGLFTPNSNNLIRNIYEKKQRKKELGFLIACIAGNISGTLGPLVYGIFGSYGMWKAMFFSSILLNIFSMFYFIKSSKHFFSRDSITNKVINMGSVVMITLLWIVTAFFLMSHLAWINKILIGCSIPLVFFVISLFKKLNMLEKNRIGFLLMLIGILLFFYIAVFQIYSSLTLFIAHHVDRYFLGWNIPVPAFSSLQCIFFIICAPLVQKVMNLLHDRKIYLSLLVKIQIGLIIGTIGFLFFTIGEWSSTTTGSCSMIWIIIGNLFLGLGEVFIYPPILAAIATYSPKRFSGTFMGLFSVSLALSSYFASLIAKLIVGKGAENIGVSILSLDYAKISLSLFCVTIITAICFLCIKKWYDKQQLLLEINYL